MYDTLFMEVRYKAKELVGNLLDENFWDPFMIIVIVDDQISEIHASLFSFTSSEVLLDNIQILFVVVFICIKLAVSSWK